jgi:hypothetical protein
MTAKTVGLLPDEIEQMTFANLDGLPILYSVNGSYALTPTPRGRKWTAVDQNVAGEATVLDERQFFRSFGSDLPPLPEPMRKFDHRLWLVDRDGLVFSRFLRRTRSSQDPTAEFGAPADRVTVLFQKLKINDTLKIISTPAGDEFDLRRLQYSVGPGFGWATEYRIRRQDDDGEFWEILSIDENDVRCKSDTLDADDDLTFTSMGNFTTEEAKDYFDSVHFTISDAEWRQMGWRNLRSAEEQDCRNCGEPFEGNGP